MTNSLITPCTPTPKVSKVMRTQKIRTKTDKFEQKMNMTFFENKKNPSSAKFLFKTVSFLPSQKPKDLGSPVIPLNSIIFPAQESKSKKNLKLDSHFLPQKLININHKIIKLSPEKQPKVTPKKKVGATRNISSGDIKKIYHDGSSGGSSYIADEDIKVSSIPTVEPQKFKNPVLVKNKSKNMLIVENERLTFEPIRNVSTPQTPR